MKLTFIELSPFIRFREKFLTDEDYLALQQELLDNPEKGDLIHGLVGLRKIRMADIRSNKGKQGGNHVIYYYFVSQHQLYFFTAYGKNKQTELSYEERALFLTALEAIKHEVKERQ